MNTSSYADKIDSFQTTVANLEPDLAKYAGTDGLHAQLKALLMDLRPAHDSVEAQRGSLRVSVQIRRDLAIKSGKIHRRLASMVGAHTGFDNPILAAYGITPEDNSRRGKRLTKEQKEELEKAAEITKAQAKAQAQA